MPTEKTANATPTKTTDAAPERIKGPASYFPSIERTYGKPIAEWKQLIRATGITKHMELVTWLKTEHGLGHGHANALVGHTLAEQE
jgi:Domain of unknown function (DUF4287)